jgi:two-component system NtrC family sensor kinase
MRLSSESRFRWSIVTVLTISMVLIGIVNFSFDSAPSQAEIRWLAIESLLQALILIALAVALSYLISLRIVRPVKQDVGRGGFAVNIPANDRRSDEVGDLARAFAAITQALQESRERLEKSVQDERQQAAELARANKANLEMMRELELAQERNIQTAKMAAIGQLTGGVAHEINNPLASILGFAQLGLQKLVALRNKSVESKDIAFLERYLGYVESEAKRSAQIISKMLSFTTSPDREMRPADVNQLLHEALKMNTNQLAVSGIKIEMRLVEGAVMVDVHTASLIQAINNIISNAITAMPEGGTLTVTTRLEGADAFARPPAIEMRFEDTGIGIPAENISKVFEPFFTTAEPGKGTGLGMYVCYQVIKQHDGDIEISSHQRQGTTVTIRLPISSAEEDVESL